MYGDRPSWRARCRRQARSASNTFSPAASSGMGALPSFRVTAGGASLDAAVGRRASRRPAIRFSSAVRAVQSGERWDGVGAMPLPRRVGGRAALVAAGAWLVEAEAWRRTVVGQEGRRPLAAPATYAPGPQSHKEGPSTCP